MKERIMQIMQQMGISKSEFADKIGINVTSLSHIISGRNNPSLNVVSGIHLAYPQINIDWLLYGKGEMITTENPSENREIPSEGQMIFDFSTEKPSEGPQKQPEPIVKEEIKYIEKPAPKITEIRIFFDNDTFQVFHPDK